MSRWPSATRRRSARDEAVSRSIRLLLAAASASASAIAARAPARSAALVGWPARVEPQLVRARRAPRRSVRRARLEPRDRLLRLDPAVGARRRRHGRRRARPRPKSRVERRGALRAPRRAAPRFARAAPDRRRPPAPAAPAPRSSPRSRPAAAPAKGTGPGETQPASRAGEEDRGARLHRPSLCRRARPRNTGLRRRRPGVARLRPCPYVAASRAPVAQLDRAPDYESGGRRFESFRARHSFFLHCSCEMTPSYVEGSDEAPRACDVPGRRRRGGSRRPRRRRRRSRRARPRSGELGFRATPSAARANMRTSTRSTGRRGQRRPARPRLRRLRSLSGGDRPRRLQPRQ